MRHDFEQMQHRISRILQILQVCDLPGRFEKKLVTGAGRPPCKHRCLVHAIKSVADLLNPELPTAINAASLALSTG